MSTTLEDQTQVSHLTTDSSVSDSSEISSPSDTIEKKLTEWTRPVTEKNISFNNLARVSEVFLIDSQCGVLVHKRSLQNIPYRKAQQLFVKHLRKIGHKTLNPYFRDDNIDFFYLNKNDIYLVAVHPQAQQDSVISVVIYLDFLQRLYEVLKDCMGIVNEAYVTVNKMLVFEVLDEMLTLGYGHVSSYNEIKPHLTLDPIRPKIPQSDELATRFFGINVADRSRQRTNSSESKQKAPNSAYINIVEGLSAVLGPGGEVRSSELWGKLSLISTLRRPAPIVIQLTPDLVVKSTTDAVGQVAGAVHIENPSFHNCVDASQLSRSKSLRILPPPDQTRLMVYTLSESACIRLPILLLPSVSPIQQSRDRSLSLRLINQAESNASASHVRVKVQLPQCVSSVSSVRCNERQTCQFNPDDKVMDWEVKRSSGGSEEIITVRLILHPDNCVELSDVGPISVAFNITNFSASGLVVRTAHVEMPGGKEVSLQGPECFFGVSTKAASYTVRTDEDG